MSGKITLTLTPVQAKILFAVIDGAADAGACHDGNTPQEKEALEAMSAKLLARRADWKYAKVQKA